MKLKDVLLFDQIKIEYSVFDWEDDGAIVERKTISWVLVDGKVLSGKLVISKKTTPYGEMVIFAMIDGDEATVMLNWEQFELLGYSLKHVPEIPESNDDAQSLS